jgi:hypothetical protein
MGYVSISWCALVRVVNALGSALSGLVEAHLHPETSCPTAAWCSPHFLVLCSQSAGAVTREVSVNIARSMSSVRGAGSQGKQRAGDAGAAAAVALCFHTHCFHSEYIWVPLWPWAGRAQALTDSFQLVAVGQHLQQLLGPPGLPGIQQRLWLSSMLMQTPL